MDIKVQKSFNVVMQLDDSEATKLAAILYQTVSHASVPLARELYSALCEVLENDSPECDYRLTYSTSTKIFVPDGGDE